MCVYTHSPPPRNSNVEERQLKKEGGLKLNFKRRTWPPMFHFPLFIKAERGGDNIYFTANSNRVINGSFLGGSPPLVREKERKEKNMRQ